MPDHQGSIHQLMDSNGEVVESVSYDSFGNGSSSLTRYGYTGREWDADTNLFYYRNRWYDPQIGRFISEDPIGLAGGINSYAYVGNNPHSFTDPSGLIGIPDELISRIKSQRQPLYPDNYDWWGTFWSEAGQRNWQSCKDSFQSFKQTYYDPLANPIKYLYNQPEVQFFLISIGMPFGTPWAGAGAGASTATVGAEAPTAETAASRYAVTESGVAVPTEAAELKANMQLLQETSSNPATARKFVGADSQGPLRVRIEQGHPSTPGYTGPIDPLHTIDHLHIDRRLNGATGPWQSKEKISYVWPF